MVDVTSSFSSISEARVVDGIRKWTDHGVDVERFGYGRSRTGNIEAAHCPDGLLGITDCLAVQLDLGE